LFRNNSTILVNRLFKLTLRDLSLTCLSIATDILLPEPHGSVTSHKQRFAFSTSSGVRGLRGDCQGRPCHGWSRRVTLDAHRDTVSMENRPRGEGLTVGRNASFPCLDLLPGTLFRHADHPHLPARSAPPPAPFRGAGSAWR
jgi:hypothetical protein